ncbi:MAG: CHAT domain-containing protein [Bacteroidales bacterium]|nr:CHAT domain-containing protein [Bacteroidales bacterium]
MKRLVLLLATIPFCLHAFSQIENKIQKAESLVKSCLSSDADIIADCLGEANELYVSAYDEFVSKDMSATEIGELPYARMMFHVGLYRQQNFYFKECIPYYDTAMSVYAKTDKLDNDDVWRCFEMLEVLKSYYSYDLVDYEKHLRYALLNADFTKKYLKKQYHELSNAMEEVAFAYMNINEYGKAEEAIDEALKAEEKAGGKDSEHYFSLEQYKDLIVSNEEYSIDAYIPIIYQPIENPANHRDSLYNKLLDSYNVEEAMLPFEELQGLFEKEGMKSTADSMMYAKSLYHIAMQCWNASLNSDDDENTALMTARTTRYLKSADELCVSPENAISEPHADILYEIAVIYNNGRNDWETAMKYAEAALNIFTKLPSNDYRNQRIINILTALGDQYSSDGLHDYDKAILYYEKMADFSRDKDIDQYIYSLTNIGRCYMQKGNIDKSIEYYLQAYNSDDSTNGGNVNVILKLAEAYETAGNQKEAEKYRKEYNYIIENEVNDIDEAIVPTSYMSISDFLTVAVDDDEVEQLYSSSFRPTKGTHCDSLRYDAVCAIMKRSSTNPSERINSTRPIMIAFEDYFAKGNATHTDSIYYAYSLYNVGKYICDAAKGFKGTQMLLEAKEMFEALSLTNTRNYANTLYELALAKEEPIEYYTAAYNAYKTLPTNIFINNRCMKILGELLDYGEKKYDHELSIRTLDEIESYLEQHTDYIEEEELETLKIQVNTRKAELYSLLLNYDSSILCYKKALALMDKAGMKKKYIYCETVHKLADICRSNQNYNDAKKYSKQYEKLSKKFKQEESDDGEFWVGDDTYDTDIYGMEEQSELEKLYQYLYMLNTSIRSNNISDCRPYAIETYGKIKNLFERDGYNTSNDSIIYEYSLLHMGYIEYISEKYDSALDYMSELDRFLPQSNSISGSNYAEVHYYYLLYKALALAGKEETREALKNFDLILDYYKRLESRDEYYEIDYTMMLYAAYINTTLHDYDKAFVYYDYLMSHFDENEISDNYFATKYAISSTYAEMGEYVSVIGCLEPEFKRFEYTYVDSDICATICNLLGNAYVAVGNYDRAYKCYILAQESIRVYKGADSFAEVQTLNNLGNFCKKTGKYRVAIDYYDDALAMLDRIQSDNLAEYAVLYENKGTSYTMLGRYNEAMPLLEKSLSINKEAYGENSSHYATTLCNIALTYKSRGEYDKALKNYNEALSILRNIYDDKHPTYAETFNGIGDVYFAMGEYNKAAESFTEAMEINRKHVANDFSFLTSAEREMYWEKNKDMSQHILRCGSKLPNNDVISSGAYNAELITKGLLLTSDIEFTRSVYESGDSALISDYANLISMKNKLGKAYEMPVEDRYIDCRELKEKINTAERELVAKVEKYGGFNASIGLTWKDVQSAMRKGDVAVEFTRYEVDSTETRYAALLVNKFMKSPMFVPLCTEKDLQRLLRTGVMPEKPSDDRGATVLRDRRMGVYTSTDLYNAIWKPLEKYFTPNARIYFAPTGLLHQVAIEYAMINSTKSISDTYEIYRVSSTRFLAMDYSPRPFDEAVLYGGISYDSDTASMKRESERFGTRTASYNSFADISKDEERSSLSYLPGTKTEVETINAKLKAGKIKVDMHIGEAANEESFKDLSGKKVSLLHIATHGFFMPADTILNSEQSLNLSGLLLAGANNIWTNQPVPEGVEDGVLTAKEISNMDLRDADMVVLSACQTGLGEITDEGVFGLQRGFKKAGVHTLIMSLWSVDDNATQLMMTEFYSNLMAGMSKREAFLKAQHKLKTTKDFENPRFWAAFIMLDGNE